VPPAALQQPPSTIPSVPIPVPIDIGAPKPTRLFELKWGADLSEDYSDNFNLTTRKPVTNFRTTIGPRAMLFIHGAHVEGLLVGQSGAAWDSSSEDFSYFPNVLGQVTVEVTPRWTLGASGSFIRGDQASQTNRLGIQPVRQTFTTTSLGLTSNYALSTLSFRHSYQFNEFDQENGQTSTTHTAGAGASLTLAQINTLGLDYTYTHNDTAAAGAGTGSASSSGFASISNSGTGQKSHLDGNEIALSFVREVTARLTAGLSGNYAWRTSTTDAFGSQPRTSRDFTRYGGTFFSTFTLPSLILRGSAGVARLESGSTTPETLFTSVTNATYLAGPLTINVALEQGFSETFNAGQNVGVVKTQGASAGLSYAFTSKVTGSVNGGYRKNEQTGIAGGASGTDNKVWTASANLSWQARQWLTVALDYIYTDNEPIGTASRVSGANSASSISTGGTNTAFQENHARLSLKFDF